MTRFVAITCSFAVLVGANFASAEDRDVDIQIVQKKGGSAVTKVIIVTADGKKREILVGDGKLDGKSVKGLPKGVRIHVDKSVDERRIKNGDGKSTVTRRVVGRAVIVGPDGKKREIKFNEKGIDPKALQGLPKDIRIRLEAAIKGDGKGNVRKLQTRAIIIGPDGKPLNWKGIDELPKDIRNRIKSLHNKHTHGIFVGPHGKKFEFKIDGSKGADLDAVLKNLPKDVRDQVRKALANRWKPAPRIEVRSSSNDKLDLILKRLDRLQKQVDELRKRVDRK